MKIVIAEKPSLGRSVMEALQTTGEHFVNKGEYFEGKEYIVTSAFGHLFALCDIEDYIDVKGWRLDYLPFRPDKYKFKLKKDTSKRFNEIKKLLDSDKVDTVYHCGDPDREGQVIVDRILIEAGNKKPVYRLWLTDQTEKVVLNGIKTAKPNSEYKKLYEEGMVRMIADWDYGINLTRYATVKTNSFPPLRVGRVKGAITKAIYDRDKEIETFVPEKFYKVISKEETAGVPVELTCKERFSKDELDEATALSEKINSYEAKVSEISEKDKKVSAPKLFSQSDLQNYMNKKYGFSPDKTLALTQSLYDKKLTTYPRTDSQYMTTPEKEYAKEILEAHSNGQLVFKDSKRIFDDAKVKAHSAITPTAKVASDGDFRSEDERKCYEAILNRFRAVFWAEDCIVSVTEMSITAGEYLFAIKGEVLKQAGFKSIEKPLENEEGKEDKAVSLPPLKKGDNVNTDFKPVEKMTVPPKHYTVESLNNYLKNPFKKECSEENDDELYKNLLAGLEIGTEATRAGIIKDLLSSKYIVLKKSTYEIMDDGKYLIETLEKLGIDMSSSKTAFMGKLCTDVAAGSISIKEALDIVHNEVTEIIQKNAEIAAKEKPAREVIAKCPICGNDIYENSKAFSCSNKDCHVVLFKNDKYFATMNKTITKTMAKDLFSGKEVFLKGIKGKKGNYNIKIGADFSGKYPAYSRSYS